MKVYLIAFILFLFPSIIAFPIVKLIGGKNRYRFGRKSRVGFSLVITPKLHIEDGAMILNGNFIRVTAIKMRKDSIIKCFNILKGNYQVCMDEKTVINKSNKIVNALCEKQVSSLVIGYNSIIGVNHFIDMTHNVVIGKNSILAGIGSQLWTHSFYHDKQGSGRIREEKAIEIGNNIYVGSRCIICPGVMIVDTISIGAGAVISKPLLKPGLYVNQSLRYIDREAHPVV